MTRETVHKAISLELEKAYALPDAPSINAQESVDLLFQFLEYQPEENRLKQFSKGISDAFGQHDYEVLAKGIEPFIKVLLFLVDRQQYNELDAERNEHGHPVALPAWANAVGLTSHKKDSTKLNKFDLRRYFATLMDSRNEESHTAPDLDAVRKAHIVNAACVIYIWLINKYSDTIKLALLAEENRAYLERTVSTNKDIRATHVEIAVGVTLENSTDPLGGRGGFKMDLSSLSKKSSKQKGSQKSEDHEEEKPNVTTASLSYRSHPRSVLLGRPGGGKTTTLRLIALNESEVLLKGDYTQTFFPIYVRLNDFNRNAGIGIKELIQETFPPTAFEDLLKNRVILLLDGLNEVRSDEIADVIREVVDIQQQLVVGRMIVSTRPQAFLGGITGTHLEIQMLDDALMSDLVSKHMDGDSEKSEACLKFLKEDRNLTEWARNPLHLYMLAETYRTLEKPPENRGKLLEAFVCNIHKREALQGKHSCDINTLNTLLGHLAIDNIQTGNFHRPWHDVINVLKASATGIGTSLDIPELIATLMDNNILRGQADREVGFAHEMYQDYFAARLWAEDASLIDFEADQEVEKWIQVIQIRNDLINDPTDLSLFKRLIKIDYWAAFQAIYGREIDRSLSDVPDQYVNLDEVKHKNLAAFSLRQNKLQESGPEEELNPTRPLLLEAVNAALTTHVEDWKKSNKDEHKSDLVTKIARCSLIGLMLGEYRGVMQILDSLDEELASAVWQEEEALGNLSSLGSVMTSVCDELSEPDKAIPSEFDDWLQSLIKTDRIIFLREINIDKVQGTPDTFFLVHNRFSFRALEILYSNESACPFTHLLYGLNLAFGPPDLLPSGRDEVRGLAIYRVVFFQYYLAEERLLKEVQDLRKDHIAGATLSILGLTSLIMKENPKLFHDPQNLVGEILERCKQEGIQDDNILGASYAYHLERDEFEEAANCCRRALESKHGLVPFVPKAYFAWHLADNILEGRIDDNASDALEVLRPSAESGDLFCIHRLGAALIWDVGKAHKNIPEGIRLLEIAAKMGHEDAMVKLGEIHCDSDEDLGVEKNPAIGMGWLENAVKEGSSEAMLMLGLKLRQSDASRAFDLLLTAARKGQVDAGLEVFRMFYNPYFELRTHYAKLLEHIKNGKERRNLEKDILKNEETLETAEGRLGLYITDLLKHAPDTWRVWQFAKSAERMRLEDPEVFDPSAARLYEEFRKLFPAELTRFAEWKRSKERKLNPGQDEEEFDDELYQDELDYKETLREEIAYNLARNADPEIGRNLFLKYLDLCLGDDLNARSDFKFFSFMLTDWTQREKEIVPLGADPNAREKEWTALSVRTPELAEKILELIHEALEYVKPKHVETRRALSFLLCELHNGTYNFIPEDSEKRLAGMKKLLDCDPPDIVALRSLIAHPGNNDGLHSDRSASQEYIETYWERVKNLGAKARVAQFWGLIHKVAVSLYHGNHTEAGQVAEVIGKIPKGEPEEPPVTTPQYASEIIKAYAHSKDDPVPANLPPPLNVTKRYELETETVIAPYLHALLLAKGLDKRFQGGKGWKEADKLVNPEGWSALSHPVFFLNPDDADFHILSALLIRNNHDHKYGQSFGEKVTPETLARHIDKAKAGGWEVPDWMYEIKIEEE